MNGMAAAVLRATYQYDVDYGVLNRFLPSYTSSGEGGAPTQILDVHKFSFTTWCHRILIKLSTWVEATMEKERKRQQRVLAELKGQTDHLSREVETAENKCHRAETGVGGVSTRVLVPEVGKHFLVAYNTNFLARSLSLLKVYF